MKTILVVDDSPDFAAMMRHALKEEGYNVIVASDGKEGALAVHRKRPDLILLDVMMPVKDGRETAQYLSLMKKFSDIPVIFVTADDAPDGSPYPFTLMVDGREYPKVTKPVHRADIVSYVKTVLAD